MAGTGLTRGELAAMWPRGPGGKFLPKSQWPTAAPKAAEPPLPDAAQAARDKVFLGEEVAEPPQLPAEPPQLPPKEEPEKAAAGGAAQGAAAGSMFGPWGVAAGAVIGAGAGYLTSRKPDPVGSFQGGAVTGGSDDDLRQLLELQRRVAAVGLPIKNMVTTAATGSRW